MIQMTYQKSNGDIILREVLYSRFKIGETTSMGWKVVDIKYKYKGKYYSRSEYDRLLDKEMKKDKQIMFIKRHLKQLFQELKDCMFLLVFFKMIVSYLSK